MSRCHFGLWMVWSGVTSGNKWPDPRSLTDGIVWSEGHFLSELEFDLRSLQSGDGLIRYHLRVLIVRSYLLFQRTVIWSDVTSVWDISDDRSHPDGNCLIIGSFSARTRMIEDHFGQGIVWSEVTWDGIDQIIGLLRAHSNLIRVIFSWDGLLRGLLSALWSDQRDLWSHNSQDRLSERKMMINLTYCQGII